MIVMRILRNVRKMKLVFMLCVEEQSLVNMIFYSLAQMRQSLFHKAQSKDIFANGAIGAAEKLIHKENGYYTFDNL